MRIALVNWSSRRAGGAETYLTALVPALTSRDHKLGLWSEGQEPAEREPITPDAPFALGEENAISQLRDWKPDVIYCHGLKDPERERHVIEVAPAVFFAHSYYGTCISGTKTWAFPIVRPCSRRFGPACLAHFYPHRCGGLNPVTMLRDYSRQASRLALLARYRAILTNSTHMRDEYLHHGFAPERVHKVTMPVTDAGPRGGDPRAKKPDNTLRLAFIGRMDRLKGGEFLLDALPAVRRAIQRPVSVTFAGDGPERSRWIEKAKTIMADDSNISIAFPGWLKTDERDALLESIDLLVVPSVWPEPFGLTGPEAGLRGVPAAAFATGGVTDWLKDGVNGFTAAGDAPRAADLADAIIRCVSDPPTHARLREGALRVARQFRMDAHLTELIPILERVRA